MRELLQTYGATIVGGIAGVGIIGYTNRTGNAIDVGGFLVILLFAGAVGIAFALLRR